MSAPTDRVRVKEAVPVASDFASPQGTPIVVNNAYLTGGAYYLDNAGNIVRIGNSYFINVKDYGAVGDGATDDTTAINAAITAAGSLGYRRIYFPTGTYLLSSALTLSGGDFMLWGDGPSASILLTSHANNCINFTGVTTVRDNQKLEVLHLGFKTTNASALAAISGAWSLSGGGVYAAQPCILVSDVEVGAGSSSAVFKYGCFLTGASHGTIENLATYHYASGIRSGSIGVYLDGLGGSPNLTDFKVQGCTFHYANAGCYCVDTEGVHFNQNTVLSCNYGLFFDTTLTIGKPYFDATGNHLACCNVGIYVNEMVQFFIADNLIYGLREPTLSTVFQGIYIQMGSISAGVGLNSVVRDNTFLIYTGSSGAFTTTYGVYVAGASGTATSVLIKGTRTENYTHLIYLDTNCVNAVVLDDNSSSTGETWTDVSGLNSLPYGKFTPAGYAGTNVTANSDVTPGEARWTRSGNIVSCAGSVAVDPTAAGATTTFYLDLPVITNRSAATELSGVINPKSINAPGGVAEMDTASNPDKVIFSVYMTIATSVTFNYVYNYRVS